MWDIGWTLVYHSHFLHWPHRLRWERQDFCSNETEKAMIAIKYCGIGTGCFQGIAEVTYIFKEPLSEGLNVFKIKITTTLLWFKEEKKEFEFRSWNFDPACVVRRITINKLNFVLEWLMSGVVVVLWNGGGLGMLWITTTISPAHKPSRCTVIKCLRRGLVFYPGKSNGCCCRGFLVFQVSSKIRTMILLDALTFFLILWLNPWYLSEYLHLPVLLTHLTFFPQSLLQSVDLHGPSTEPYKCGILLP